VRHIRVRATVALWLVAPAGSLRGQIVQRPSVPEHPFEKPVGPYAIGSIDTLWIDSARDEIVSRRQAPRVLVQIWHPVESAAGPEAPDLRRQDLVGHAGCAEVGGFDRQRLTTRRGHANHQQMGEVREGTSDRARTGVSV
jgi:hypothetical protein